jgi:hypothetical protein
MPLPTDPKTRIESAMGYVLHDFGPRGIVVMKGQRLVAKGRPIRNRGVWQLTIVGASWANTMRNEKQKAHYKRHGLPPDCAPWLTSVPRRRDALCILSDIARI